MSDIDDIRERVRSLRTYIEKRDQDILTTLNDVLVLLNRGLNE